MSADALRAKALRRQITIEQKVATRDAMGGESYSYTTRCTCFAEVRPAGGKESLISAEMVAGETYEFRIRHRTDVAFTDRVVWKGQPLDIIALVEVGRNVALRIVAKAPGGKGTAEA